MKITNVMNLPQSLVNACGLEEHNKPGCISATTLLKGVKQVILEHRHWEELEDDVSNRCWQLFGTSVHKLLEEKNPDAFTEEHFEFQTGGKTVTGQVDLYDMEEKTITDYKTASVWKVIYKSFDDWKKQGLIYAWLLKHQGLEVNKCRFIAMLRDWSVGEAKKKPEYPQSQIYEYTFDVTKSDLAEIGMFITKKVEEIVNAEGMSDDDIPPCSAEERWAKGDTWAVMKEGRKTALKVCDTQEEAEEYASKAGADCHVEKREGKSPRCEDYCLCCNYCNFYKKLKGE